MQEAQPSYARTIKFISTKTLNEKLENKIQRRQSLKVMPESQFSRSLSRDQDLLKGAIKSNAKVNL